jgi:hypothetical protein
MGCRRSGSAQHRCLRLTAGRSRGGDAPARPAAAAPAAARGAGPTTADAVSPPPARLGTVGRRRPAVSRRCNRGGGAAARPASAAAAPQPPSWLGAVGHWRQAVGPPPSEHFRG